MYLRFFEPYGDKDFGFVTDEMCQEGDIKITDEDHKLFFKYQSQCKSFSIKNREGKSLFEILEVIDNEIKVIETPMEKLQKSQVQQDNDIVTNLLANTELFEMVLNMIPKPVVATKSLGATSMTTNQMEVGDGIVEVYVTLIKKEIKTVSDIPFIIQSKVVERLEQLGISI
jgi:hypothetical protein